MNHGEAQTVQHDVGPLRQPAPQIGAVVVAPACDQPSRPGGQRIKQVHLDPVTGVDDDVGAVHLIPDLGRQVAGAFGDMRVGEEQ